MTREELLHQRSGSLCELCGNTETLQAYDVPPGAAEVDKSILVCTTCLEQLQGTQPPDANHWRCLNTSMWSTVPAVQVTAWRLLTRLSDQGWPQDLLDMLYLDDETLAWAKSGMGEEESVAEQQVVHKDSNGTILATGDTVVLIKDLDVKGGGFTAKRGTAVKGIALVDDNAAQIEGRINGQQIVILTQYVKKSM
ncbi:PhnA domain-containing protein [Fulvivirgaceae bacterium PWU5]|uniref:PhnA domain-containing protein n=1 Tax=Dawidia cretensis TaxID=2782350 RepID=A0AAP2DXN0_9BACT|nr:alkylphosphonate utilization protein [Dawidia cretensis]MBT1709520.1 PhnA domain-containing protein [Dawidia cretensis]